MTATIRSVVRAAVLGTLALPLAGCSIRMMAINSLGNAVASGSSSTFGKDDDPELIRDAVPFALKTIESLIEQSPTHRGLLTAAASGFTQYGYAFVQQEADFVEAQDLDRATQMRARAKKFYLRAADYGLRGLALDLPGFRDRIATDPDAVLAGARNKHVPLLYWTGAAWAGVSETSRARRKASRFMGQCGGTTPMLAEVLGIVIRRKSSTRVIFYGAGSSSMTMSL